MKIQILLVVLLGLAVLPSMAFAIPYCDGSYYSGMGDCMSNATDDLTLNQTWSLTKNLGALMKFPLLHNAPQGIMHNLILNFYVEANDTVNSFVRIWCDDGRFGYMGWTEDLNDTDAFRQILNNMKNYDLPYVDFAFQGVGWNSYNLTGIIFDSIPYPPVGCYQLNDEQLTMFVELVDYPVHTKGMTFQGENDDRLLVGYQFAPLFNFSSNESDNVPYITTRYDIPVPQHGNLTANLPSVYGDNATFEMNWTNKVGMDYVWFDSNYTGTPTNYTMDDYYPLYIIKTSVIPSGTDFYVRVCGAGWSYWWESWACADTEYFMVAYPPPPPPPPTMAAVFCYDSNTLGSFAVTVIGTNITNTTVYTNCPNGCQNNVCVQSSIDSFLIGLIFFVVIFAALMILKRANSFFFKLLGILIIFILLLLIANSLTIVDTARTLIYLMIGMFGLVGLWYAFVE